MNDRKRKAEDIPFANCNGVHVMKKNNSEVSLGQPVVEEEDLIFDGFPSTQESNYGGTGEQSWSADHLAQKLDKIGLIEIAQKFREQNISGAVLDMITEEQLTAMGVDKIGDRLQVLKFIRGISEEHQRKVFNDPVHGHMEIHPLCVKIIDTPQFQRLRYIKQLGACYFVYPGAGHNRFEHCIGVCHLAGQLARTLKKRQPELDITNKDVLCVEIAGLCHDLGHGPFSHLFDGKFIPTVRPKLKWKHEDASVIMFDYLIKENELREEFERFGLTEQDITFVKEQIAGPLKKNKNEWPYQGREEKKGFLYEIVANKRNGIDVDKWDYFARDCHGLGIKNNFDHHRFMKFSRVLNVDGTLQICSRDKEADTLYSMFQIRATLHRRAYQHRVCNAIETMITDAFIHADKKGIIPGKDGKLVRLSECIDDPVAYTSLNDSIFHVILMSTDKELAKSREILQRIQRRQLYKCVGETTPTEGKTKDDVSKIKEEIMSCIEEESCDMLRPNDLVVHLVYLDYGMKTENPIKNVRFYNKNDVTKAVILDKHHVSLMLPGVFAEQLIRLYCKKTDEESLKIARDSFQKWCVDKGLLSKQDSLTPDKDLNGLKTPDNKPSTESKSTPVSAGKFKQRLSF
ncbi:deoxynucleoside triphosphate triphosphohydrolase SAMHD1-like isoform X2 [Mytilus californianus]|uniref:deoxynucleoside triphosphate triphosphohydrolase SAMHD1-like isoform X2 n=1 Tax=Mytilus californianus TaxID=6549 RepID=UPI002247C3B2|nr:deoxynucleoside triphosphate triphosphohydrolase SAMHD1-like isoform X2 [Mytilus californianus]